MNQKREKGITLIALVITIIVLLVLAGVTINMVLGDEGIIHQAEEAKQLQKSKAVEEEVELWIANNKTAKYRGGEGEIEVDEFIKSLKNKGLITDENVEDTTINIGDYEVDLADKNPLNASGEGSKAQWALPENDTEVNVGDLLTPTVDGLENEKFYVIADDGTTLTLLAELCIDTSENKQHFRNYDWVRFDDDSNVYKGSEIQGLVNAYVGTLTGLDLEDVEVIYGGDPVAGVKGRLMWYEEATALEDAYDVIIYARSYWLGSPLENTTGFAHLVDSGDNEITSCRVDDDYTFALRPVIKILKSNLDESQVPT